MRRIPNVLTIAGSDSGGGAGIQADLKTFSACNSYGCSVITAITAQNTQSVDAVSVVSPEMVEAQIRAVFDDIEIAAVKIGMLATKEIVLTVARLLREYDAPNIVLDTVMLAKSGDALLAEDACAALWEELIPQASIFTPNLPEAAALLNAHEATTFAEAEQHCDQLAARTATPFLLKGGHLAGQTCRDILYDNGEINFFTGERVTTNNTHGTGCTLSAAIAAHLAHGASLAQAAASSIDYVRAAIHGSDRLHVGSGHGPLLHFHEQW